jgi:O-antigen ligase
MLVGLVETGSRGAMLGFAAMVVYVFIRTRQRWRLAIAALPIAIVLGVLNVHASMWSRFAQSVSTGGSGRLPIWTVGLAALRSHWLIGAGYNNFGFAYDKVLMAVPQPHFANWHRAPHDLLLETSVELGILAGWVSQFQMMRGVATNDPDYRFRLALEAALIATFVAALFLDVMITKYVWLMFMLIALLRNAHAGARRTWGASSVLAAAPAIRGSTPGLGKTGRDLVV